MAEIRNYVTTLVNALTGKKTPQMPNRGLTSKDRRLIDQIIQTFVSRSKQDIGTWRTNLTIAENVKNPKRFRLYQTYKDSMLDDQVIACIGNLKASVKSEQFYIGDSKNSEKDEESSKLIERPWFYDFIDSCIDSMIWGFVLLELGDMIKTDLGIEIVSFDELPREHVIPEFSLLVENVGDEKGIDYSDPMWAKSVFPIGKKNNLGLLNPVSPKAIIKKNVETAWAEFCEMFGMPIRVGKVASRNPADLDRMEAFLKGMGSAAYAVTGIDDIIELKESSKGDAYQVYDKLMDRQDKAISKIFLGNTMTTDDGSSRSQAEVHERVGDKRMFELKLFIEFTINFRLFPFLIANGYKLEGKKFCWEASTEITDTDIKMDEFLVKYFEFDNLDYFKKKYRVPIKAIKEKLEPGTKEPDTSDPVKKKKGQLSRIELLNHSIEELYAGHAH